MADKEAKRPVVSAELVNSYRRERVLTALIEVAQEKKIERVRVSDICAAAKMSRLTFYRLYDNRDACLNHAFEQAFAEIFASTSEIAKEGNGPWLARVRAGIGALYDKASSEPGLAELYLAHSPATALPADRYLEAGVGVLTRLIEAGRDPAAPESDALRPGVGPLVDEYLARSILSLARLRVLQGEAARLPGHTDEMTWLVANAFFGMEAGTEAMRALVGEPTPA